MVAAELNTNIDGITAATAAAVLVAAALGPVAVAAAFVTALGFAGWVNGALNDRRGSLRLDLRQGFYGFLRDRPRSDWHGGKRRNLHGILPANTSDGSPNQYKSIVSEHHEQVINYLKIVNHYLHKLALDKLLIFNLFGLVTGTMQRLSQCQQMYT
jgi:hypothetical protein